jgi:hypothetical protein
VEAYQQKRGEMEAAEQGLSTKAERFFVLVQVSVVAGPGACLRLDLSSV